MKAGLDHAGSLFLRAVVKRMKTMGLSQSELARRMHASRPYVVKVLRGDVNITLGSAARFAKALQMDFLPVLIDRGTRKATSRQHFPLMGSSLMGAGDEG